jgi:hypothetical protein
MNLIRSVRSLCGPAKAFLIITLLHMALIIYNMHNYGIYPFCFNEDMCNTIYTYHNLGSSFLFIFVYTIILNIICSYDYHFIAWLLFAILLIFRFVTDFSINMEF